MNPIDAAPGLLAPLLFILSVFRWRSHRYASAALSFAGAVFAALGLFAGVAALEGWGAFLGAWGLILNWGKP